MNQPKPKAKFALGDYVEVADRIKAWHEEFPEGRIETELLSITDKLVVTKSRVYRTSDPQEAPAGIGHSMLGIPGKTTFTRDSELENCETSSVGRALVMAGIPAKSIASANEIRSKGNAAPEQRQQSKPVDSKAAALEVPPEWLGKMADAQQEIARATSMDDMDALKVVMKEYPEAVKVVLRPLYSAKVDVIRSATQQA
jgi:hypothetical protein